MDAQLDIVEEIKNDIKQNNIKHNYIFDINTKLNTNLIYIRKQLMEIGKLMYSFIEDDYKQHIQIQGSRGIGKTAQIIYLTEEFQKKYDNISIHYINCNQHNTSYKVIKEILHDNSKLPMNKIINKFIEHFDNDNKIFLILDEIDHLKDDKILYTITRELRLKNIYLIMLTNKVSFYSSLSKDVQSSLNHKFFYFDRYDAHEGYEILKRRAEQGLINYNGNILRYIALINMKHFNSDIRLSIKTMQEIFNKIDYSNYSNEDILKIMKDKQTNQTNQIIIHLNDVNLVILYLTSQYSKSNELYVEFKDAGYNYVKSYFLQFLDELEKLELIYCIKKREHRSFILEVLNKLTKENSELVNLLIEDKGLMKNKYMDEDISQLNK